MPAIVTFSNTPLYDEHQKRQEESLEKVGYKGDYFHFHDYKEIGSPTHEEVPYAFKPYAIEKVRSMGYKHILWLDSPIAAVKPLHRVFDHIKGFNYLFFNNLGYDIRSYTSDLCLLKLGECNINAPMIMACAMGFNFNSYPTSLLFSAYKHWSTVKGCYEGDWHNNDKKMSADIECQGHRHDQSVMSILINQHGYNITHPNKTFFAYNNHKGHKPWSKEVCLVSG